MHDSSLDWPRAPAALRDIRDRKAARPANHRPKKMATVRDLDIRPVQDPESALERALIDEFLRMAGHDSASLRALPAAERDRLLQAASMYAADRLAEVEARARYVHALHGHS